MKTPEEIKRELSSKIDRLMAEMFPGAKREAGGRYVMADMRGDAEGRSCNVFKAKNSSVYVAKDHQTGESCNILELCHRKLGGSFSETMRWALKFCGFEQIRTVKTEERAEVKAIPDTALRGSEVHRYMVEKRGINERTLGKYNIFAEEKNGSHWWGTPLYDSEGRCRMLKYTCITRIGNKKQIYSTQPVFNTPFGLHLVGEDDRELIICEGEIDCMSLYQMQKESRIPVIAVPSASNHGWIENCFEMLTRMERIYVASDMDDAGQQMFIKLSQRLSADRCYRIEIPEPHNDVNDWLVKDHPTEDDLKRLMDSAKGNEPEALVKPNDFVLQMQDCVTQQEREREWKNWCFQDMPLSLRESELFTIIGIPGSGKSQIAYQLLLHLASTGTKCMAVSFEVPIENMMLQLGTQLLGEEPKHEQCAQVAAELGENIYFIDDTNFRDNGSNWEGLKAEIILAKQKYGINTILIDSFSYLAPKLDFEQQGLISKDLARTAVKHQLSIVLIAHADAKSKENGGTKYAPTSPGSILGSQELSQASHTICSMHRNTAKELAMSNGSPEEQDKFKKQGDATFTVFKQRNSGVNFSRDLWFDTKTRLFQTSPISTLSPEDEYWYNID